MNVGMLWFDNDPKVTLDGKIARAVAYYHDKYGRKPTVCFVHPSMLRNGKTAVESLDSNSPNGAAEKKFAACGVEIRPNPTVLPNHLWIGVNGTG